MTRQDEYITTNEAASVLEVTRQRVLQLIQDGRLKAEKFGNVYMIRRPDLSNIEAKPMGRPPKPSNTEKTATRQPRASNGASTKKKGR
jgi:excisionase family DNA binding protein